MLSYDMEAATEEGDMAVRLLGSEPAEAPAARTPTMEKRSRVDAGLAAEDALGAEAEVDRREPGPDPPRIRQSRIQSGTLTAGSFDDNERFEDYRQFLSEVMQEDADEKLPRLAIGRRVMIEVRDQRGAPVGDARVVVRQGKPRHQLDEAEARVLLELTTASDGRVMFLTGRDGAGSTGEFLLTVHPPDQGRPVTQQMHVGQGPWRITLPDGRSKLPRRLDLCLVIDTTGSMGDELEYLKVEIDSIAKTIYQMFPQVDQRYSLVVYRDDGDQYVTRTFDFTASLAEFRATLSEQSANGGGNYAEAMHLALESAGQLDWRDEESARVLFLVADAPPHDRYAERTLEAVEDLRRQGVRVFPVAASGVATKAEFVMRAAGFLTLGQYLFLTDHSGVGNAHAEPHVPDYQVERLDRLMIRMIASELAGRRLAAALGAAGGGGGRPLRGRFAGVAGPVVRVPRLPGSLPIPHDSRDACVPLLALKDLGGSTGEALFAALPIERLSGKPCRRAGSGFHAVLASSGTRVARPEARLQQAWPPPRRSDSRIIRRTVW
jgi:uncharacterized protein YegL